MSNLAMRSSTCDTQHQISVKFRFSDSPRKHSHSSGGIATHKLLPVPAIANFALEASLPGTQDALKPTQVLALMVPSKLRLNTANSLLALSTRQIWFCAAIYPLFCALQYTVLVC
jgi:hypothetical protein